ncbi:MAG: hypothetical protein A2463_04985 [Candidatus Staskawiczbacteria bacterium RIFOXYC2_FULL_32_10]|nr:MAG: hypothetical protein A2463_04985 [Candidatus Staskawiczbacteria bacterium RIFOXYC2_FULL_32_10]
MERKSIFEKLDLHRLRTPIYVLDLDKVDENLQVIRKAIGSVRSDLHYAMFSNDNPYLLEFLKEKGAGVLALGLGELRKARRYGFSNEKIHLTGGTFNSEQLDEISREGVDFNVDSLSQLEKLSNSQVGIRVRVSSREAVGVGEGVNLTDAKKVLEISSRQGNSLVGLHTYIGTNTIEHEKYLDAFSALIGFSLNFKDLRYINLGGGFGISYSEKGASFNWGKFGEGIKSLTKNQRFVLKLEPGRSIVGNAGYFFTRVMEKRGEDTLIVDAPYTNFARPFVYHKNHRVEVVGKEGRDKIFKVRGCTINSNDFLSHPDFDGDPAYLPKNVAEGDILCFRDVGAYSPVMQMDFLGYRKAKTLVVGGKNE